MDAIKKYVEDGGRALFLLDPPLKLGHEEIADNDALTSLLQGWGVTMDKDLILDLNPIGQIAGARSAGRTCHKLRHSADRGRMKGMATGFPLSRSLEIKSSDKTSVQKLFDSSGEQPGDEQSEFASG